jgi:hypothetical protein
MCVWHKWRSEMVHEVCHYNRCESQITDNLYLIMLHTSPWSRFELTTSVAIGTDCIGSCKSNHQTITATTAPHWTRSRVKCLIWLFGLTLKSLNSKKVINSTNINRTNTYWTEPTEHKRTTTYDVGNQHPRHTLALGQVQISRVTSHAYNIYVC